MHNSRPHQKEGLPRENRDWLRTTAHDRNKEVRRLRRGMRRELRLVVERQAPYAHHQAILASRRESTWYSLMYHGLFRKV